MAEAQVESGLSFLSRIKSQQDDIELEPSLFGRSLHPPEVIEITGKAGAGKSYLCSHLAVSVLLPRYWLGIEIDGKESSVIFIDCDKHFNILIFREMIEKRIKKIYQKYKANSKLSTNDATGLLNMTKSELKLSIQSLVKTCLSRFIYMYCKDSSQFYITLLTLDQIILNNEGVSLVVIDSISSFYWYDRASRMNTWQKTEQFYNKIFSSFNDIIKKNNLIAVCTKQELFKKQKDNFEKYQDDYANSDRMYEFMGKTWSKLVSIHIDISLNDFSKMDLSRKFGMKISIDNSERNLICTYHGEGIRFHKD